MKKVVVERHTITKEIWTVPDVYEMGEDPSLVHGHRNSIGQLDLSPVTYRNMIPGEGPEPAQDGKAKEKAERGYWGRALGEWRKYLQLEDYLKG